MTVSTHRMPRQTAVSAIFLALTIALAGCGAPERLPSDLSIDDSTDVIRERVIAPIKGDEETGELAEFEMLPRRQLIQVRHSPNSLRDQYFVSTLEKLVSDMPASEDAAAMAQSSAGRTLTESEVNAIAEQRALERTEYLVGKGLEYEAQLLTLLRDLDIEINSGLEKTVSGLSGTIPVFGRNLTGIDDTFLEVPNDLIFVGGENGTISSKTALLKRMLDNPEISFAVREMPLAEALQFLFQTVGLQATLSEAIIELDSTVTLTVQASAISIIDALLEQNALAIVYDPAIEVAQIYTQSEFSQRMQEVRTSIGNYNAVLRERMNLEASQDDKRRVTEILGYVQLLLSGDDEGFIIGMESVSRDPAGQKTSELIADMTRAAIDLRATMVAFDQSTQSKLAGEQGLSEIAGLSDLNKRVDLENILSEDACIWPRQEIFTEKVAVYNAIIIEGEDTNTGVVGRVNRFFDETRPTQAAEANNDDDDESNSSAPNLPSYCGNDNPAPAKPIILPDDTGITIIGTREDNDLVVRLIEQYDVPELQVLIEIFIITVSRDFSRQIDSILSANPAAGGSGTQEAVLSQVARAAATTAGTFSLDLGSPNDELGLLLNFIESNSLGRVVSSPTILVAAGKDATIERDQIARVPGPNILDADNRSVAGPPVEYNAPFKLEINEVNINRLNNTVKLDVKLTDTRFNTALALVDELSDRTSDVIDTTFWASPGDVVVLAGLTRNEETTTTAGLPGTTGVLAPIAPLLGGSDALSSNMSETLIFMAPTVIDPSSENQPHSAFRKR